MRAEAIQVTLPRAGAFAVEFPLALIEAGRAPKKSPQSFMDK